MSDVTVTFKLSDSAGKDFSRYAVFYKRKGSENETLIGAIGSAYLDFTTKPGSVRFSINSPGLFQIAYTGGPSVSIPEKPLSNEEPGNPGGSEDSEIVKQNKSAYDFVQAVFSKIASVHAKISQTRIGSGTAASVCIGGGNRTSNPMESSYGYDLSMKSCDHVPQEILQSNRMHVSASATVSDVVSIYHVFAVACLGDKHFYKSVDILNNTTSEGEVIRGDPFDGRGNFKNYCPEQ